MKRRCPQLFLMLMLLAGSLDAQPLDLVLVPANEPFVFSSNYFHWDNTVYRWTVRGSGSLGDAGSDLRMIADARFALGEINNLPTPRLPLSDDENGFGEYCARLADEGTCDIYFATNALSDEGNRLDKLEVSNAAAMKRFRFRPQPDVYNPDHVYTLDVIGSDRVAEFMMVDRFDAERCREGCLPYNDNFNGDSPTQFEVEIRRVSPELLIVDDSNGERIISDEVPGGAGHSVRHAERINFGTVLVGSDGLLVERLLRNRGLESLEIERIEVDATSDDLAQFRLSRSDGRRIDAAVNIAGPGSGEELRLTLEYQPQRSGRHELQLHIICNDPTQNNEAQQSFDFILRGEGTTAALEVTEEETGGEALTFVDLDCVQRDDELRRRLFVRGVSDEPAEQVRLEGLAPPFFASASWGADPRSFGRGESAAIDLRFAPRGIGFFRDTLVVTGANIQPYRLALLGYSYFDSLFVYFDWQQRGDSVDTLDFGIQCENQIDTLFLTVRNYGNMEWLLPRDKRADQGYILEDGRVNGGLTRALHFDDEQFLLDPREIDRRPSNQFGSHSERRFPIIFNGLNDILAPGESRFGQKEAIFTLRLTNKCDPSSFIEKRFFLRVFKTDLLLIGKPPVLDMGLVYLDSSKSKALELANCGTAVDVSSDQLIDRNIDGSATGMRKNSGGLPPPRIEADATIPIAIDYQPRDLGPDLAEYEVIYHESGNPARPETTRVQVRGFGVQQTVLVERVEPAGTCELRYEGDLAIIDFGEVALCNQSLACSFPLLNLSNFIFGIERITQRTLELENDFSFNNLPRNGTRIGVGESSEALQAVFLPRSTGQHRVELEIRSDIADRVCGAPEEKRIVRIQFQAFVTAPLFAARAPGLSEGAVDFDSALVISNCGRQRLLPIEICNDGNQDLEIEEVRVEPPTHFELQSKRRFTVPGGGNCDTIWMAFLPQEVGELQASLRLKTNAGCPDSTVNLPLRGVGLSAPAITVTMPPELRARPGSRIALPITLDEVGSGGALRFASSLALSLHYNQSLLRYDGFSIAGTALAAVDPDNIIVQPEADPDRLVINLASETNFVPSDSLIVLFFTTFVGDQAFTPLAFDEFSIGDMNCSSILAVDTTGSASIFVADSVCGIHVLTVPTGSAQRFRLGISQPHPVIDETELEYAVAFQTSVEILMFNSRGEIVFVVADALHPAGVYRARIPAADLPPGMYFYTMRAGIFSATRQLLKTR